MPADPLLLGAAALAALAALGLFALSAWRPALGCALLVLLVPLSTGLARGAVLPLLRPSEAVAGLVLAGVLLHSLPRLRPQELTWIDLAVGLFTVVGVAVPSFVLAFTGAGAGVDTWRVVLSPIQFFGVYLLFSRTRFSSRELRLVVGLALLAGAVVGLVAVAQLVDVPGARVAVAAFYPTPPQPSWDTTYRPDSLVGHYSTVGGLCLLDFVLALALAGSRHPAFSAPLLAGAMLANLLGIIASETFAPFLMLPLATLALLVMYRRLPRSLLWLGGGLAAGGVLLWPLISGRVASQLLLGGGQPALALPESLQTRVRFWTEFIVPALRQNLWLGSGTVIPGSVPAPLADFVDNEYLWAGFRAGIPGIAVLVTLLLVVAVAGWRQRTAADPWRRAIGPAASASALSILVLGVTAQYITFGGIVQAFAMVVGLLTGLSAARAQRPLALVLAPAGGPWPNPAGRQRRPVAMASEPAPTMLTGPSRSPAGRRHRFLGLAPERALLTSSGIVFAGFSVARFLGFLFSIAAARLLAPAEFGRLAFGLAVVGLASVLLSSAPNGLARFLARHDSDRDEQETLLANWVVLVVLLLLLSAVVALPAGLLAGVSPGLVAGVAANLVGIAALETYREAQRGLGRYWDLVAYYVAANLIQLVAVLLLGLAGLRSAPLFLIVYGLSGLAPLAVMQAVRPFSLSLRRSALDAGRVLGIAHFIWPVLLQSVFYAAWLGADLIIVQRFLGPEATGNYGAAKTLANLLILPSTAISTAVGPRVARLAGRALTGYLGGAVSLTAILTVPLAGGLAVLAGPLCLLVFGARYPLAPGPEPILAAGMVLYALYSILGSAWIGLGRPRVDTVATGAGMLVTVSAGLFLAPRLGLVGAADGFALGSAARLAVITGFTAWNLATRSFVPLEHALRPTG